MGTATVKAEVEGGARRGRRATATPDEVLAAATAQYVRGDRVDLTIIARELGVGRATIYRWFRSREGLLGEVIATELEKLIDRKRAKVRRRGGEGLLEVFDAINRALAHSFALRRLLEQEPANALRVLTSSAGVVQPRAVARLAQLIADEVTAGRFEPPTDIDTLAYAIVRLAEAFLYSDATIGLRGDHTRLRAVEAALLGVRSPRA